ncbi:MAG: TonB family protein [Verrucomicrobiota bacterium]
MDRTYGLPIALAAALHGAVLFGFNCKTSRAEQPKPPKTIVTEYALHAPPEELPPIILAGEASEAKNAPPERPQPISSPEPAAVEVTSVFTFTPPPVPVNINQEDMRSPIWSPPGVKDGKGEGPDFSNVLAGVNLDRTPNAKFQGAPIYPFEQKRLGERGEVMVDFVVDETGSVIHANVVSSSNRAFEENTLRAVMKWKFEPGKRNGRVVPFRMVVPVVFNLNE